MRRRLSDAAADLRGNGARAALAVTALVGIGLQLRAILPPLLNVDEAIEGLAARQVLVGHFPIFFYGQAHMGTPGVFALAVPLAAHVPPALAVKGLALVVYGVFVASTFTLAVAAFDRATARLAQALALVPAPYLFEWSHEGRTHYTLVLALGTLLLLFGHRLAVAGGPPRRWLAFGVVGGLGLWTSFFGLFYLVPSLAVVVASRGRGFIGQRGRPAMLAATGFALGSAPLWLFNIAHRGASFDFTGATPGTPGPALRRLLTITLPALTGPSPLPPDGPGLLAWAATAVALASLGVAFAAAVRAWQARTSTRWAWLLVLGVAGVTIVVHLRAGYAQDPVRIAGAPGPLMAEGRGADPRYALALASVLPLTQARLCLAVGRLLPGRELAPALALVAVHAVMDASLALGFTGQKEAALTAAAEDEAVHQQLLAEGVEGVYTDHWPSLYAFSWGPHLPVAHPYQDVYPEVALRVDAARRVAFLLREPTGQWAALSGSLRAAGITFRETQLGRWRMLSDLASEGAVAPLRADGWRASASVGDDEAGAAIDGDVSSRWTTGRGRRDGDTFTLELDRPERLTGLRWLPGSHQEVPSGIRVEGSTDGTHWAPMVETRTYLGPLFLSGPHPIVRLRGGRVELRFPPTTLRAVRLVHIGEARAAWSILELSPLAPVRTAPRRDLGLLLSVLETLGVRHVHADHWLAAAVQVATEGRLTGPISNEAVDAYGQLGPRSDVVLPLDLVAGDALVVEAEAAADAEGALDAAGRPVTVDLAGGFAVIRPRPGARRLDTRLTGLGGSATASHHASEAGRAIDGRLDTHWRSGADQRPEMAVEVDLGRPYRLGGLRLLPARVREMPRGLAVEISADGHSWTPVPTEWRGRLAWTGWSVARASGGIYAIAFPPQDARWVRLTLTAGGPGHEWSIAEVEWLLADTGK